MSYTSWPNRRRSGQISIIIFFSLEFDVNIPFDNLLRKILTDMPSICIRSTQINRFRWAFNATFVYLLSRLLKFIFFTIGFYWPIMFRLDLRIIFVYIFSFLSYAFANASLLYSTSFRHFVFRVTLWFENSFFFFCCLENSAT